MQYIKVSHIVSHIPTMPAVYHHFGRFNQPPFLILGISGAEVGVLGLHTRVMIVMVATVMMVDGRHGRGRHGGCYGRYGRDDCDGCSGGLG